MDLPEHTASLVDILRWRAEAHPRRTAFTFVGGHSTGTSSLSYGYLDDRARTLGALLQGLGAKGERAALLFPSGLEFINAFFGCLYSEVIAVPCAPLRAAGGAGAFEAILKDTGAKFVLGTAETIARAQRALPEWRDAVTWIDVAEARETTATEWVPAPIQSEDLAFLQYTSGSTGHPKGIMVSHGNILANQKMICNAFGHDADATIVGWLPMFHDMGLIGNVMQPVFCGSHGVLLSPASFVQRPMRWLETISRFRGRTSGGPNFGFDMCVERFDPARCAHLDLSDWTIAFNGAEPIDAQTMDRFARTFEPHGFDRDAFLPCYGLAEATLFVTSALPSAPPVVRSLDRDALASGRGIAREGQGDRTTDLVACGRTRCDATVEIVEPDTSRRCPEGEIGEIWVAGDQVAQGYWNNRSASAETFGARLSGGGAGEKGGYLRTGDLGFVDAGQLFVAGRRDDLIILRGRNLWPQDLEKTATGCHGALRSNRGAAFSVRDGAQDAISLVLELNDRTRGSTDPAQICRAVRAAITGVYYVPVSTVALVRRGTLPLTTSGKVRRRLCRRMLLEGSLAIVSRDTRPRILSDAPVPPTRAALSAMSETKRRRALSAHLAQNVAALTGAEPSAIPPGASLGALGVDSLGAAQLAHRIETAFGAPVPMVQLIEARSLSDCAMLLDDLIRKSDPAPHPVRARQGSPAPSMTQGQRALWFLQSLAPRSTAFNVTVAARIEGELDIAALRQALQQLVDRHDILRARFDATAGSPLCEIRPTQDLWFIHRDLSDRESRLSDADMLAEARHVFDLGSDPLLRVLLFTALGKEPVLVATAHHLIVDFWSLSLLLRDLGVIYDAVLSDEPARLPPRSAGYSAHVAQEDARSRAHDFQSALARWGAELKACPFETGLPFDRPPAGARPVVSAVPVSMSQKVKLRLADLAKRHDTSLFTVLLTAWQVALHRLTGQASFTVGTLTSGRTQARYAETVGYFVNPVVIPCDLTGNPSVGDLIRAAAHATRAAVANSDIPFSRLVEHLRPARAVGRSPLFSTMFNWQRTPLPDQPDLTRLALGVEGGRVPVGGLRLKPIAVPRDALDGVMELELGEVDEGITGHLTFDANLFDTGSAERAARTFCEIAQAFGEDRSGAAFALGSGVSPRVPVAQRKVPEPFGAEPASLAAVFRRTIETTPDRIAIVDDGTQISYRALGRRSARVAALLSRLEGRTARNGAFPLVAVLTGQNAHFAVGALAVLQAGQGFVPLAADDPPERNAFKLTDCEAAILITETALADAARAVARRAGSVEHIVVIDAARSLPQSRGVPHIHGAKASPHRDTAPIAPLPPHQIAYAIYTSGTSSGWPKGVLVTQDSLLSLLAWQQAHVAPEAGVRSAPRLFVTFDVGLWEVLSTLLSGGTLLFPGEGLRRDPRRYVDFVNRHAATMVYATPTLVREAVSDMRLTSVSAVMLIGETLQPDLLQRLFDRLPPGCRIINAYGPTEATVYASLFSTDLEAWRARAQIGDVPVGTGVAETTLHVLDPAGAVANGRTGEVFIGGRGVGLCYLNRPGQTAAAFLPDPMAEHPGARLYRTGDLGAFSGDGALHFHGRIDQQVNIRGFRVEPQEIETVLNRHPDISETAVVTATAADHSVALDAFVVLPEGCDTSGHELRTFASATLPDYMVPTRFFRIAALPRSQSGKLDRKAIRVELAQPLSTDQPFAAPRTAFEMLVAEAWSEALGIDRIGIHDGFFDLGGHSLKAGRIHARLEERTGIEFPVAAIFEHADIRSLAAYLEHRSNVPLAAEPDHAPMRAGQSGGGLW